MMMSTLPPFNGQPLFPAVYLEYSTVNVYTSCGSLCSAYLNGYRQVNLEDSRGADDVAHVKPLGKIVVQHLVIRH